MSDLTGTKGGSGVWQRIISEMPAHEVYIEPFWGRGTIARKKRPAQVTIGCDLDAAALASGRGFGATMFRTDGVQWLRDYFLLPLDLEDTPLYGAAPAVLAGSCDARPSVATRCDGARPLVTAAAAVAMNGDAPRVPARGASRPAATVDREEAAGVPTFGGIAVGDHFVYIDPPYLGCEGKGYYRFEPSLAGHIRICRTFLALPCPAALSGYWTDVYAAELRGCRHIEIPTVNRAGQRVLEILWLNYAPPLRYHDVRFVGWCRRGRERIRRRVKNWSRGLGAMTPQERQAVWEACGGVYQGG